tara:strand:+ start:361 stop:570 length:210 start_codon:yes stop_codon:yes gene_type:complete
MFKIKGQLFMESSKIMNEASESDTPEQSPPTMQSVLDNPFLLLFLGVTIPAVLYIIWGVMEVASIPVGQ